MRPLTGSVGVLSLIAGIGLLAWSYVSLSSFDLTNASAIQMSEVYTILIYRALLGIGALMIALICAVAYYAPPKPTEVKV